MCKATKQPMNYGTPGRNSISVIIKRENVHYYVKELFTLKYLESTVMTDHVVRVLDLHYKITSSELDLGSSLIAHALMMSLLKSVSWKLVKIQLFGLDKLTIENVSV